jgi:AraC-like DNA-binding protein
MRHGEPSRREVPEMSDTANGLTYREVSPPAALADVIECFWRRERWRPPKYTLGVLPDGRVDVIWTSEGQVLVMGPQSRSLGRPASSQVVVVGVRFPPGLGPAVLGVPARELANLHLPLDAIDARPAASLLSDLVRIEHDGAAPAGIARALMRRLESAWEPDLAVRRAATLLENPRARVEHVADALGLSERQLQRRFRELVGYGPKTLQRVLRFQRLLASIQSGRERADGLARIAPTIGYADQAHLTRDTSAFCGLTPVQLERTLRTLSDERASGIFKTGARRPAYRPTVPPSS